MSRGVEGIPVTGESRSFIGGDLSSDATSPAGCGEFFVGLEGGDSQRSSLFIERLFRRHQTFGRGI